MMFEGSENMTWFVALIGSLAGFLFGYDEGIIAGSLELVKNYFGLMKLGICSKLV